MTLTDYIITVAEESCIGRTMLCYDRGMANASKTTSRHSLRYRRCHLQYLRSSKLILYQLHGICVEKSRKSGANRGENRENKTKKKIEKSLEKEVEATQFLGFESKTIFFGY